MKISRWVIAVVTVFAQVAAMALPASTALAANQNIFTTQTPTNLDSNDSSSVSLGVKFFSSTAGYINGVRFYKGNTNNGGTHVGSLWTTNGSLLARATFTNESGTGWQDVQFNGSVPIQANTTYIASYFLPQGHYPDDNSSTPYGFQAQIDNAPLHAYASGGVSGGNGVYSYGSAPMLPMLTFNDTNYWVDVDFSTTYTAPTNVSQATPRSGIRGSGPLLVITDPTNAFSDDYCNVLLKGEGLPECAATDAGNLANVTLSNYKTVVLADGAPLTSTQITQVNTYVTNGGTFIAMKPNDNLDSLLGINTRQQGSLYDAYYKVNSTQIPGIETASMQFHGPADEHTLNGATSMATLYSDANTATSYPAMTTRTVGSGKAMAVMYDVSRSVMWLRDGNPGLAGNVTTSSDGLTRTNDRFGLGWLDPNKAAIPQADEQQRILVNVAENAGTLPRLWYFPSYKGNMTKAVVVATGDDHATNSQTLSRFAAQQAASGTCSVADWTCYTSTSYAYAGAFSDSAAKPYTDAGFEVSPHVSASGSCLSSWQTYAQLDAAVTSDINGWIAAYPTINAAYPPLTERFHCYGIWNDYASIAKDEVAHGIKADTNSECWPNAFLNVGQCLITGTGIPEQYVDTDGTATGEMQFTTQATDENTSTVALSAFNGLIGNATGTPGYYGYFTVLCHLDNLAVSNQCASDLLSSAQSNNVPMVSARQAETFNDARNSSTITGVSYANTTVSYTVTSSAHNVQLMVPTKYGAKTLQTIKIGGTSKTFTTVTINGVSYGVLTLTSTSNSVVATYK